MKKTSILVAMSGGVDSSVAATLLHRKGYEVTGVHMALRGDLKETEEDELSHITKNKNWKGCCNSEDVVDARISASKIGISFYVWNLAEQFRKTVIQDFIESYRNGNTPNPCIKCNEEIKFKVFLERAKKVGFKKISTGHYANIKKGKDGYELHRSIDSQKDQSYVLSHLSQNEIQYLYFPLGEYSKEEVRVFAEQYNLKHIAKKKDSMGICFLGGKKVKDFLAPHIKNQPGKIVYAQTGQVIGDHNGVYGYTIGQRKGIGISKTIENSSQPFYIKQIDKEKNLLIVDHINSLMTKKISIKNINWINKPLKVKDYCKVQLSAHGIAHISNIMFIKNNQIDFELDEEIVKTASGQRLAIYRDTRVVGGGTIL